jgi:hypothetical protein
LPCGHHDPRTWLLSQIAYHGRFDVYRVHAEIVSRRARFWAVPAHCCRTRLVA